MTTLKENISSTHAPYMLKMGQKRETHKTIAISLGNDWKLLWIRSSQIVWHSAISGLKNTRHETTVFKYHCHILCFNEEQLN